MLNINCVLADTVNKIRVANKYGTCIDKLEELLCYISSYQWLFNNAWDCLTDLEKKGVEVFVKANFNCTSFTTCEDEGIECGDTPLPVNDDCSGAFTIGFPTALVPYKELTEQRNDYVCSVVDYPTDSGVTLPDNWDVDSNGDIWYTFTVGKSLILNPYVQVYGGTIRYPEIAVYGGTCGSLGFLAESTGTFTDATVQVEVEWDNTYYIRVSNAGGIANAGTFKLSISLYPVI